MEWIWNHLLWSLQSQVGLVSLCYQLNPIYKFRCVFCQNWDISQQKNGWELKAEEIADLMLKLQNETKCHNINFVTPEHVVPQVIEAIALAVEGGLRVPIVYNTSGYDSLRSLELLDGLVDIYMPDFKFWSGDTSARLCKARDYPEVTRRVISEMHRQVGDLVFDQSGLAKSGVLVRHLVMPGEVTRVRLDFIKIPGSTFIDNWFTMIDDDYYVNDQWSIKSHTPHPVLFI